MRKRIIGPWTVVVALVVSVACTVHQASDAPPLTGPSEFAMAIRLTTTPDSISQDGGSQSAIAVTVLDAAGKPATGVPLRLDMVVGGVLQDFGTLSARSVVTGTDGRANAVYTAPPPPPPASGGTITIVSIVATPNGSDAQASLNNGASSDIRLVPPGVILSAADTPTAKFTVTPTPVNVNVAATFDASASCPGLASSTGACLSSTSTTITSYAWTFGDGSTASGKTVTHTFTAPGTFTVTLTVTNDRGVAASTTQAITVAVSVAPTAKFTFSPVSPVVVNQEVFFTADGSSAAAGHTIVSYSWNFGDGSPTKGGVTTTHDFGAVGDYSVTLTVTDDVGQKNTAAAQTVKVLTANPTARLSLNKVSGTTISADGSLSSATGTSTIVNYTFTWNDSTADTTGSNPVVQHPYACAAVSCSETVLLTVTDSVGRKGFTSATITVP